MAYILLGAIIGIIIGGIFCWFIPSEDKPIKI
jgi:ABC-type antimicrobial peptide transport system permease subunit